ncbi:MAG: J domain-containing protein [Proteobacteria bacterium]|nr:J domain-containing protein [Pseudomonadota bacterium]MBU1582148.1 J domain-containing protein [Pseudomonadota bacterium]MBU2456224.1 J domain-containing protein [Pseudomonadota bacterium]MBU2628645.1 J domain-containing protein [Pseudomonadota bacterium]
MEYKDYYKALDVDRKADQKEIKKAYRKLARKCHPDVNQNDSAAARKFSDLNEAYEVLSDPEKRQKYDQLGSQWQSYQRTDGRPEDFNWGKKQSASAREHTYRTADPKSFEELFGTAGGYSDFFETLFGGTNQGPAGRDHQFYHDAQPQRGKDFEHPVQVSLMEAFNGTSRVLEWEDGRKIDVKIPRGVTSGSRVRIKGQGGQGTGKNNSGDLFLQIKVLPDKRFLRDNDDLKITIFVDMFTMLLGGKLPVSGIDRSVNLDIPPETRNGRIFRLQKMGMPKMKHPDQRGDLYVTVETILPKNLTAGEKKLVEQWRDMH